MKEHKEQDDLVYDNISLDKKVIFREHGHKYIHIERPELKFTSVTTLIKQFHEKFDADTTSVKCCSDPKSEYYGMDPEAVAAEWLRYGAECAENGTRLHIYGEELLNKKKNIIVPDLPKAIHAKAAVDWLFKNGYELAMSEMLLYNEAVGVAGSDDIILKKRIYGTKEYEYMIYDWKFLSKPVARKSFYTKRDGYKMMRGPFRYLMDCNWIHYSIQLALYQTLTGDPAKVTEKVLIVVSDTGYEFIPAYPMRVFWDMNDELQCVHEIWNGRWWDSRMGELYKKKPKDIVGI
jgi:hypothetical protein